MTKNYIENYFYRRGITVNIENKNIHGYYNVYFIDRFLHADTLQGLFKLCKERLADRIIASDGHIGIVNLVNGLDDSVVLSDLSVHRICYTGEEAYFNYRSRRYLNEFIKF